MNLIVVLILRLVYFVCPILAIGALALFIFDKLEWYWVFAFWVFGFIGMFAGGAAKKLDERRRNSFTYHAGDSVSEVRAAFCEIEGSNTIPAIGLIKEKVLASLNDRSRIVATLEKEGMNPKCLIYLLISNEANELLCTGNYHFYRGHLNNIGNQLLRSFVTASQELVNSGFQTASDHEADVKSLRKEIAEIG